MNPVTLPNQPAASRRRLRIELLALDLNTCGRCTRTEANLEAALRAAADLFHEAEIDVQTEKHVVTSADEARRLRLVSSPTIRVNGKDIALDLRESPCEDCGDLCGCKGGVSCRVWIWQGREYLEAPKAMIVDAILRAYGREETAPQDPAPYRMPDNLSAFFAGSARKETKTPASSTACCDKDSCCKPPSKNETDSDRKAITQ